jgi:hypothetical protein
MSGYYPNYELSVTVSEVFSNSVFSIPYITEITNNGSDAGPIQWSSLSVMDYRANGYISVSGKYYKVAINKQEFEGKIYFWIMKKSVLSRVLDVGDGVSNMGDTTILIFNNEEYDAESDSFIGSELLLTVGQTITLIFAGITPPTVSDDPNFGGGGVAPVCFLGSAPILTPAGYRRIDSLRTGDLVQTADGRSVAIQRVKAMLTQPGPAADPFIIPAGRFGATAALPISPRHRVAVPGRGLVEARDIGGLVRLPMRAPWTYYNIGLPNWATDNLVVGGVEVESLAPVERIRVPLATFKAMLTKKYGAAAGSKAVLDRVLATCRLGADGLVETPVIRNQ